VQIEEVALPRSALCFCHPISFQMRDTSASLCPLALALPSALWLWLWLWLWLPPVSDGGTGGGQK